MTIMSGKDRECDIKIYKNLQNGFTHLYYLIKTNAQKLVSPIQSGRIKHYIS